MNDKMIEPLEQGLQDPAAAALTMQDTLAQAKSLAENITLS